MVVKPVLRTLISPDADNLESYMPKDPKNFDILVQALIGPNNGPGEESFDFEVCTARWLEAHTLGEAGHVFGRHYLFLCEYDYTVLVRAIEELCAATSGPDWQTVGELLDRYGKWEFEDYREA